MENIRDPRVVAPTSPTGLDNKINYINYNLSQDLPYINKLFGKAYKLYDKAKDKEIPQAYLGNNRYFPLTPNDRVGCFTFFDIEDPVETTTEGIFQRPTFLKADARLIMFGDFRKITPSYEYPAEDQIAKEVIDSLSRSSVRFKEYYSKTTSVVYDGYDITDNEKLLNYYPYFAIRFNIEFTYDVNLNIICQEDYFPVLP